MHVCLAEFPQFLDGLIHLLSPACHEFPSGRQDLLVGFFHIKELKDAGTELLLDIHRNQATAVTLLPEFPDGFSNQCLKLALGLLQFAHRLPVVGGNGRAFGLGEEAPPFIVGTERVPQSRHLEDFLH